MLAAAAVIGPPLLRAVRAGHPSMLGPVVAYLVVISAMAITAWCTGEPWLIVGGHALFFASDAMLGWGRFVTPTRSTRRGPDATAWVRWP